MGGGGTQQTLCCLLLQSIVGQKRWFSCRRCLEQQSCCTSKSMHHVYAFFDVKNPASSLLQPPLLEGAKPSPGSAAHAYNSIHAYMHMCT